MKKIEPIQSWLKGQKVIATILNMRPIGGELFHQAGFYYSLLDDNLMIVADGNIYMTGEAYQSWGNNDEYAYTWGASPEVLNLIIIGDYVPPVPEMTNEEILIENNI
jgi:hypothetical protein